MIDEAMGAVYDCPADPLSDGADAMRRMRRGGCRNRDTDGSAQFRRIGLTWGANAAGTHELLVPYGIDSAAVTPPRSRQRDDADARRYLRSTLAGTLAIYALLAAVMTGIVPAVLAALLLPFIYVRLSLALHELLHVRTAARVPLFHRLAMIFDTPFGLGYRELRSIHLRHHLHAATDRDPELYQIRGSHLRAMGNALISPERAMVAWVRAHGVGAAHLREGAIRCALFVVLVALNPVAFLVYWCSLRVSVGVSSFVFHHLLHDRDGVPGTFALPAPAWLVRAGAVLFGQESMRILTQHRSHHLWPDVRAADLPALPADVALAAGSPSAGEAAAGRYTASGVTNCRDSR